MRIKYALVCAAAATALAAPALQAKPFRWASAGEISTWDIHSQNNALQNGIHAAVYESLVYYNSRTFKIEPVLATSWTQVSPTQMRLNLRQNVKFHDGSAFTADDAAYSIERAMMKTSNFSPYTAGIDRVVKVNPNTIDIITKRPNPVLLNQLTELRMMSKAWAEKNNSVEPKDIRNVATSPRSSTRRSSRKPPASRPCCRARWTWCSTPARRTCRACARARTSR
ncbi:MAG: putative type dipeptide/oligopeptide transport system, periplasmic component [Ramlibacter sp.]|nr:putative type dipeptide/oligopeptide transport system, periplasmic component [Ramlibacter sp.]